MKNRPLKRVFIIFLVLVCASTQGFSIDFRNQLPSTKLIKYKHWHLEQNKTTGYTIIRIKTTHKAGKKYFLEVSQNLDLEKKIFSEKKNWFDFQTGLLVSSSETDYRTGISILNHITATDLVTEVTDGDEHLKLSLEMEEGLVPFAVLPLYLQKSIQELREKRRLTFMLYLPAVAIELKRKGLPISFSKFEIAVSIVGESKIKTPLGVKSAIRILLTPTSLLVNSILPKEKTAFHFTYMTEPPNLLLEFEENQTRSTLETYQP